MSKPNVPINEQLIKTRIRRAVEGHISGGGSVSLQEVFKRFSKKTDIELAD